MLKYIFIFLISITITSCKVKDCETLTPQDLEWVPYMFQNQEITFVNIEDTNIKIQYFIKIYHPKQNTINNDYWSQSDNECGESVFIEYIPNPSNYTIYLSIYRAYNQMGLDPSSCGCIPSIYEYKKIGFNSGIFYKDYATPYHTYHDVYMYINNNDSIWYAKNYGIIKYNKYILQ